MIYFEDRSDLTFVIGIVESFRMRVAQAFGPLLDPLGVTPPPELHAYYEELKQLMRAVGEAGNQDGPPFEVHARYASLLREAVISARLSIAKNLEVRRTRTVHPDLLQKLDAELEPYSELVESGWFQAAKPKPPPRVSDFFPIQLVEAALVNKAGPEPTREFDEKFHILQAPGLFLPDLERARQAAALRNILVAVAYLDIDKFGEINKAHGNTFVDRNVLPRFMRHIEAHVYTRGYAYRYGGDEYTIILNNVTNDEALVSMERLRAGIGELRYEGTHRTTTVSVGVVIVRPDCYLTGQEIEKMAEQAKAFAKDQGRNRVATYTGQQPRPGELRVASTAEGARAPSSLTPS